MLSPAQEAPSGPNHKHTAVGRMLHLHGGSAVLSSPGKGGRVPFLSADDRAGSAHIRGRWLGHVRHVFQAQGCCRQIAGVGPGGIHETFTGRAKVMSRCKYCSSEHHSSMECMFAPDSTPKHTNQQQSRHSSPEAGRNPSDICHLFNSKSGNRCRFNPCRFSHVCAECRGSRPASSCRPHRPQHRATRAEGRESPERPPRK